MRPLDRDRRGRHVGKVVGLAMLTLSILPPHAAFADAPVACDANDPGGTWLQVNVSGMRSASGNITVTLYPDDPAHFLDGKYKIDRQELPVTLPVTIACFKVAAPAFYAVALFHDENGNHHLDTNALGIPTEGYGFSNNPTLYLGPPDLSRVRISVHPGENQIPIRMKY